jgi:hypothetical protein
MDHALFKASGWLKPIIQFISLHLKRRLEAK